MKVTLPTTHPKVAAEWHPDKNAPLTPDDVTYGNDQKRWWRCSVNPEHVWDATVASRTTLGSGCPMCAGQVATPTTSLAGLHPQLAAEWHPEQNGSLTPDRVRPGSNKKVWWRCRLDPTHAWQ